MNVRVLHMDGRDEVYENVVKMSMAQNHMIIYADITVTIDMSYVMFMQSWVD